MRRGGLSLGLVLLLGCEGGDAPEDEVEPEPETCELSVPTRLVPAPFELPVGSYAEDLSVTVVGDHMLYAWGPLPLNKAPLYFADLCGGAPTLLERWNAAPGWDVPRTTASGPRLYGIDPETGVLSLRDRLDVPGEDEPTPLGEFPAQYVAPVEVGGHLLIVTADEGAPARVQASGVGGRTETIWTHSGDSADPLVRIADDVVNFQGPGDEHEWPLLLLTDAGAVRLVDLDAGEDRVLLEGARTVQHDPALRRLVWQQPDDDGTEAVFLRDLETGDEALLATVDFDAEAPELRTWLWSHDGAHVGLRGLDRSLESLFRADLGTPIQVPAHTAVHGSYPGGFWLTLVDDEKEQIDALWDPATDALFEFHAGEPEQNPTRLVRTDDVIEYWVDNANGLDSSVWTVDRATGERALKLPRVGSHYHELADGRLLTMLSDKGLAWDITLIDPDRGAYQTLAEKTNRHIAYVPDVGIYYIQLGSRNAGIWFAPIPPR